MQEYERTITCGGCGAETFNIEATMDFQHSRLVCSECGRRTRAMDPPARAANGGKDDG